ncbi:S8 family serine peptidase [Sporosarcina luteola]|uniref:S8 family peptidase n=1 Tax=Sporosarcina luteola TaxID=582850 RepID=UPI00203F7382|nr:S8 family serine peptidase [Sporosarcina luteola]MCM3636526.1 S8 family serine peptidase [Sporosarcina luteola]
MKKYITSIAIALTLIFALQLQTMAQEQQGEYLISGGKQAELMEYMKESGMHIEKMYPSLDILSVSLSSAELAKLEKAFPNIVIQSNRSYQKSTEKDLASSTLINTTRGSTSPYTGKGVKVAVLDSGIDVKHRDLRVKGGYCSMKTECAMVVSYDDDNGHGTHVAGVIAALSNQTGIVGIAPSVELYSIKALNSFGVGTTNSLIDGIDWAMKQKIDILNLSITTDQDDPALEKALQKAYAQGVLIVASGGNNGDQANSTVMYPAKYDSVIAVAAVNADLTKLKNSAVGKEIEIAAPGASIFSTYPMKWDFEDGKADGYTRLSGTSMATAHVSGILALYKERFPHMNNDELRQLIARTAKDLGKEGRDDVFGHGLIQYKPSFDNTVDFTVQSEPGKLTLQYSGNKDVQIDGANVLHRTDGKWEIYGVAGDLEVLVKTKIDQGAVWQEKKIYKMPSPVFTDMNNSQRFAGSIGFLTYKGQLKGFPGGTIRPYENITRAEAAAIIGRALGYPEKATAVAFKDVSPTSFAGGYIQALKEEKILSGFKDGTFKPEQKVTRGEMAILISNAFKLKSDNVNRFTDSHPSMASYSAVNALVSAKITNGYTDGTFKPNDQMSRADFAVFLARVQEDAFK